MEKQRRIELEQKLLKQAGEHYDRCLLLHRGITPWKQLVEQSHANVQVNTHTHTPIPVGWHSFTASHIIISSTKPSCCLSHSAAFSPLLYWCSRPTGAFTPFQMFIKMDEQRQDIEPGAGGKKKMAMREKYTLNPISHKSSKRSQPTRWPVQCENVDVI